MTRMDPSLLVQCLTVRYSVKQFDGNQKIDQTTWEALAQSLVLTPSSYGLQPWKFVVVTNKELKQKLRAVSFNQPQVEDCSHFIIFCARTHMDATWIDKHLNHIAQVRNITRASLQKLFEITFNDLCGFRKEHAPASNAQQCFIALGNLITGAAALGVDTCPLEGFLPKEYNKILFPDSTDWNCIVACATGYRSCQDKFANLAKVRFPIEHVIEYRN
jgi:nitroreductase